MPKIAYINKDFAKATKRVIVQAVGIIEEYQQQGFSLTLRQLYYQFVARDLIPNTPASYNRLGRIISDARLAGYIDWYTIEDRTRNAEENSHWDDPASIINSALEEYKIDMWERQNYHVEVWIEKEALAGVIQRVCRELDIISFACKGYVSQSEMWNAGRRMGRAEREGKNSIVLHLGDHDPSGIDMTRDIELRLNDFAVEPHYRGVGDGEWTDPEWAEYNRENLWPIAVKRIALNMDQIRELNPPPNPAKVTDSRFDGYRKNYGSKSWELDALEPRYIENLIRQEVEQYIDWDIWGEDIERLEADKENLRRISTNYDKVEKFVSKL